MSALLFGVARAQPSGCFGDITALAGTVSVQTRKGMEWEPAVLTRCMFEEYALRTGTNSGAVVALDDDSRIYLSENTEIHFTDTIERFLLTRLDGMSLLQGEVYFALTAGYDPIMVETPAAAATLDGAMAVIMLRAEDPSAGFATGTSVFVLEGAADVFDIYLMHKVTVGPGQQTNVTREKTPQPVYFYPKESVKKYVDYWKSLFTDGVQTPQLYKDASLESRRAAFLGCPKFYYQRGLMCCPDSCKTGPSKVPADIYCPSGTFFNGARKCCDNACY